MEARSTSANGIYFVWFKNNSDWRMINQSLFLFILSSLFNWIHQIATLFQNSLWKDHNYRNIWQRLKLGPSTISSRHLPLPNSTVCAAWRSLTVSKNSSGRFLWTVWAKTWDLTKHELVNQPSRPCKVCKSTLENMRPNALLGLDRRFTKNSINHFHGLNQCPLLITKIWK